MASLFRLRLLSLARTRKFTTSTQPRPQPSYSKEKSRAALSLIKAEQDPQKIIQICESSSLNPDNHLDRIACSVAIGKLSKSDVPPSSTIVPDFLRRLRLSRPDLPTDSFAAHSIVLFGEANLLDHSILTFKEGHGETIDDRISKPGSVKQLNALLFACILTKNYDKVKEIFVEFPRVYNIEPDLQTYNTVIKAYSMSGHSSWVYSILAVMDRRRVKPNATSFGEWLAGVYREERFEEVGKVLSMMSRKYKIHPAIGIYNIRIQSLCKLRRTQQANDLFQGMLSRGMKPNSNTFSHLIHGFCREGNMEQARSLFENMRSRGCEPDYGCYSTLGYYLCQNGEFMDAYRICMQSIEKGWVPNVSTMKSLVEGLGRIGKVWEAKLLVDKIKGKFTRNAGMWDEVKAALVL